MADILRRVKRLTANNENKNIPFTPYLRAWQSGVSLATCVFGFEISHAELSLLPNLFCISSNSTLSGKVRLGKARLGSV